MRRRDFITGIVGSATAWPLAARAQQIERMRRVGVFSGFPNEANGQLWFRAFKGQLESLGWVEGRNLNLRYRWAAGDPDRIRDLASEMVGSSPDAILAMTTPALSALRRQTPTIPLVFVNVSDPVDGGFVESIARPGGNITGFTSFEYSIGGKWLALLKEAAPSIERVLVVFNPKNYTSRRLMQTIKDVAPPLGMTPIPAEVQHSSEVEQSINEFAKMPKGGVILLPDPVTAINLIRTIELMLKYRLPALHQSRFFAERGGLMSYGADFPELYRTAASYVDRILKGEKIGELPVQNPTKFEFVLNLKSAKVLGVELPANLLALADAVIE
jgi:ABC-type uncharacterized transport system substrate-binding protein